MNKKIISLIVVIITIVMLFFFYLTASKEKLVISDEIEKASSAETNLGDKSTKSKYVFYFEFNRSEIKDSENIDTFLRDLGIALKERKLKNLTLVGHTDSIGSKQYNKSLSDRRVHAFSEKFNTYNISIKYVLKGESDPIASNETEEGRAKNRRIEIFLGL